MVKRFNYIMSDLAANWKNASSCMYNNFLFRKTKSLIVLGINYHLSKI